jgi:hypothetical protein
MGGDNRSDNGEPETRPASLAGPSRISPPEALEDAFLRPRWNAWSLVGDDQLGVLVIASCRQAY